MDEQAPVLVVGGSLVGLTATALLAHHGVPSLTVERHPGTSIHPRFRGITARSMEIYRTLGLEEAIRAVGDADHAFGLVASAHTLADEELTAAAAPTDEAATGISPTELMAVDQDQLEPLLLERVHELGGEVRFGTELVRFEQEAGGVTAVLRDRATDEERTVRCSYLLAADGARSPIRHQLGVGTSGPGVFAQRMSIVFRADLTRALRGRVFFSCTIGALDGASLVRRRPGVWQLAVDYHPEHGEGPADFPPSRCRELLRTATGDPYLEAEVLSVLPWELAAWISDHYQDGRVFLAGDAAHVWPPYGGFNGNTGIQDAHNLAWKLAAVLADVAPPALLDTYEPERRPVAALTMAWALKRMTHRMDVPGAEFSDDYSTIGLGYRYGAPVTDSRSAAKTENPRHPSGEPGTRAAHVTIGPGGRSTLDLFGRDVVLLTGSDGDGWSRAGRELGLVVHRLDQDGFTDAYGIKSDGATMVRPDGFIAWRSTAGSDEPEQQLRGALANLYCRHA